jgi:hypothetical protein
MNKTCGKVGSVKADTLGPNNAEVLVRLAVNGDEWSFWLFLPTPGDEHTFFGLLRTAFEAA